ncbi:LPS export ABC transporter periplasmic protein LptC [Methylosoma difficile]
MNTSQYYGLIYTGILALFSWWLVQLTDFGVSQSIPVPPHSPDFFSKDYRKWEMDSQGEVKKRLLTEAIIHYSDDGVTHLQKPLIYFHNGQAAPWEIASETGILSADGKELLLNGKVFIDRAKSAQTRGLKINTSNLKVNPATNTAETKDAAQLISPPNLTTGIGMKLVFVEPIHLELLGNVKGNYEKK